MGFIKYLLAICFLGLALLHVSLAQSSHQDFVNAHNAARAKVGVGPLRWNYTIAAYAQNYANKRSGDCNLEHSEGPYGENLAEGYDNLNGVDAVNLWIAEKSYYNHKSNQCVGGECLHYTQVVWRDSVHLGCARVKCHNGWMFVICSYDPPAFVFLMSLTLVHLTLAQDSKEDYLNAHNAARADVGVPSLTWDDTVAAYAQNYANQRIGDCNLVHSGGKYGENIAWGSADLSGTDAVKMWVDEKANYDYNSNSCVGGQCGHYTQVVWRNSVRLGCAKVRCNNGGTFIGCNYDPPGNYVGN
ncbi:basic form of pathogenesis-related protein 1 [Quercus suber]|uniref:Basic form of pathogenesis-related protein 1 n=1 Tax=Quercus suber TaxID=58331 RepID=A0AAW0L2C8_QUESU